MIYTLFKKKAQAGFTWEHPWWSSKNDNVIKNQEKCPLEQQEAKGIPQKQKTNDKTEEEERPWPWALDSL